MPLTPAHPLAGPPPECRDALGGRLGIWRVDDLVSEGVKPKGQLPVLGQAAAPTEVPQERGPDHVRGPGDHLQRSDELLAWALDHVASGVLGPHALGEPALALVEDVPLVALHGGDFWAGLRGMRAAVAVAIAVGLEEVGEEALDRVGEGHD